ncbi:MAG: O-antigen translocase [Sphingobacteriaceae bacterium]|nr:MAG: O-antigen translocase [Sphingobacteriaceae bacterium]
MNLLKTSFFSAISTLLKISSSFVANKIVATYTGPSGIALIGQFTNLITILSTFANGAINSGVVKYTSEFNGNEIKLKSLFSTSLKISIFCSISIGFILVCASRYFSLWFLNTVDYKSIIRIFGIVIVLYSLNVLFLSILNGKQEIKKFTLINSISSIVGLILTVFLVIYWSLYGALLSLVIIQSVVFFITIIILLKTTWFRISYFKEPFDKLLFRKLFQYSLMSIITVLTVPIAQIFIRNYIINNLSLQQAGYWQGLLRISDGYLLIITTSLSTYYLPKLSSLKTKKDIRTEIIYGYKLLLPFVLISCIAIFILRFFIIKVLYTDSFQPMSKLFLFQLIGDFFKIASWILAYIMVAKSMIKLYITTEIIFSISYSIFGIVLMHYFGIIGVTYAFALNYFLYLMVMLFAFKSILLKR